MNVTNLANPLGSKILQLAEKLLVADRLSNPNSKGPNFGPPTISLVDADIVAALCRLTYLTGHGKSNIRRHPLSTRKPAYLSR